MTLSIDIAHVDKLLKDLRDVPVNTEGASDSFLGPIYTYLMKVTPNPSDGVLHWFCDRAGQLTIHAATFLIRLFAYNSPRVDAWKEKFEACLGSCSDCVKGLEEAKLSSKATYFGAFSDEVLKGFYNSFNEWELNMVISALSRVGITSTISDKPRLPLSNAPSPIVYHMVCNLQILRDPRILPIIHAHPPLDVLPGWPTDPPPAGVLILLIDKHVQEKFVGPYTVAIDIIAQAVSATQINGLSTLTAPAMTFNGTINTTGSFNAFSYATDPVDLWSGFCAFLRLIPPELLTSSTHLNIDLRRLVTGHLHDTGPHFVDILRCLMFLLKRLNNGIWHGEGPEYPQVVFDAVKDNPSYSQLLQTVDPGGDRPWFLSWFSEYLQTLRDLPVYGDVLAKMVDFMCEELQHERFQEARPTIMIAATRLISSVMRKSQSEISSRQSAAVASVLDIHAEVFVSVAFARPYNDPKWKNARVTAREMITGTMAKDVQVVSAAITQLCRLLAGRETVVPSCSIRQQIWAKSYDSLQSNDFDGIPTMISIVARSAHLDVLNKKPFIPTVQKAQASESPNPLVVLDDINHSLTVIRSGFLDILSKCANYNVSTAILDLLRRPSVVKDIMVLMLSPIEDLQVAAQTLVGQAFDVDVRLDCFRALLENLPDAALDGLFEFLETFIHYSPVVPEACGLSKSLVRCLTDIIEVLCTGHDGLLHNDRFLRATDKNGPASALPKLWALMAKSITVIFKRTPLWSTYFENEDMIVWMRDALIFGRDMLSQRRVIESAGVLAADQASILEASRSRKSSPLGQKMVNDLQEVLPELARWLRLTDEELLHQSFALLQSLLECFRESDILPASTSIAKLNKHIDDARKKDPNRPQTRLDSTRLSKLEDALAAFDEDEDIQIISHIVPAPRDTVAKLSDTKIKSGLTQKPSKQETSTHPRHGAVAPKTLTALPSSKVNFTARDQQKLDKDVSLPTFRRQEKLPMPRTSTTAIQPLVGRPTDAGPKSDDTKKETTEYSSSSDDEESDEEESQTGLAALGKFQRSPKIRKPAERRQVKMLDIHSKGKKPVNVRLNQRQDARRTALRLKPDISGLHRALLSWDYDHVGPEPPISGEKLKLVHIPDKFSDHNVYRSIFEPLLLMECWSQIVQSKDENQEVCDCMITSRQFIDDWLDLEVSISEPVPKDWYLTETDVVLLRHLDGKGCIIAKVRSYQAMPHGIQAGLRSLVNHNKADLGLHINSSWRLSKVFSLSTLHREYAALVALPYYDLYEKILRPQLSPIPAINPQDVNQTMSTYNVNRPQAVAILASLQADGFALIQGPPGTGKTSTICGLVQTFLSRRPRPITFLHAGRNTGPMDRESPKKILLCAPSNAAIDEVAHRIKESRVGSSPPIKVVRLGNDKSINISVKDISLDYLVEQKLNGDQGQKRTSMETGNETAAVRTEIEAVKRMKQQKLEELSTVHDNLARSVALEEEIKKLNGRRMALTQQFDKLKDKKKSELRSVDAIRRKIRAEVLNEADVICSTLSGAGHESVEPFEFEMVIIDEAAQAIELSSLIPLKFRCKRCIMVGDPQQLPPTVLSQEACKYLYNQSLFVRLQKHHPEAVHLLSIQYRMHPDISQLPSHLFYHGRLQDGPEMAIKTQQPWHSHPMFGTYRFLNVSRGQEQQAVTGHSIKNKVECQVAVALYARIRQEFSSVDLDFRVGVVSMYRGQILELQRSFEQRFGRDILGKVHFSTVDGFQGQEKDIIILSCVRAGPGLQSVGFLSDTRRMNVAITRAKSSLFILGHAPTLERSDNHWRQIIQDARSRSIFTDTDVSYFTTPAGAISQTPVLPRPSKPAPKAIPAIPLDLAKPRDLVATVNRGPSLESAPSHKHKQGISMKQDDQSSKNAHRVATDKQESPVDHQMPAMGHNPEDASTLNEERVRVPPAKRPKKDKANIFIPKKLNKRPPPEADLLGPPNARRRL